MAANGMSPYGPIGMSGNADLESARALRSIVGQVGGASWSPAPGYPAGSGRVTPTTWGPGTVANPAVATPYSPMATVTRPSMAYSPGGTLGTPIPGQKPQPPASVPYQQPMMGGALSGSNGLAGMPGGPYTAMPGGFSGTAPGLANLSPSAGGLLGTAPRQNHPLLEDPDYNPIPGMDVLGPLASGVGMLTGTPAGLLGMAGRGWNLMQTNQARDVLGMEPLGFWQRLGAFFGLNDYASGGPTRTAGLNAPGVAHAQDRGDTVSRNPRQSSHSAAANVQ